MREALLLSGGLESTCIAWWKRPALALTVDYGQVTANGEAEAARAVCSYIGIEHRVLEARLPFVHRGRMTGTKVNYDDDHPEFWPFRNQHLITCAAMAVSGTDVGNLLIGSTVADRKFADGTTSFVALISGLLRTQDSHLSVMAPAIGMTTVELLSVSKLPRSLAGVTFSCHASSMPCGGCGGCAKNQEALSAYYG